VPIWLASPGGYSSPPDRSNKNPELVHQSRVAWQSGVYRQAVSLQEPKINIKMMSHLAAIHHSPGGF